MAGGVVALGVLAFSTGCAPEPASPRPAPGDAIVVPVLLSPLEVAGAPGAFALFDRDTTTGMAPLGSAAALTIDAQFEVTEVVHEILVFARGQEGRLQVTGDRGWAMTIDLGSLAPGWNIVRLEEPTPTDSARFTLTSAGLGVGAAAGVGRARMPELALWGRAPHRVPATASDVRALYELPATDDPLARRAQSPRFSSLDVAEATPALITLSPSDGGTRCATFRATLPRPSAAYRSAWLAYRTQGIFRPFLLSRAINDVARRDGAWVVDGGDAAIVVEEIDVAALASRGADNELRFCLPAEADAPAVLSRLRLFAELDDGDVQADVTAREQGAELVFPRQVQPREVVLGAGAVGLDEIGAACVGEDETEVPLALERDGQRYSIEGPAPSCRRLEVSFPGAADSEVALAVRDAFVIGMGARTAADWPALVVTSPLEHFGNAAWVEGFAGDMNDGTLLTSITVDGTRVDPMGRGFGALISRTGPATSAWPVTVSATFLDGRELRRDVTLVLGEQVAIGAGVGGGSGLDGERGGDDLARYGAEGTTASESVGAAAGGEVWLGSHVGVRVPPGAVAEGATIDVIHLGSDVLPPLGPGMVNVTAPRGHGYEFLPHGQRFARPVELSVPFDPLLIPEGQSVSDVTSYFFDPHARRWRPLERAGVNEEAGVVKSVTDHFTIVINATVVTPEHPELATFNPTQIKDIQAANPATGITLIEPPQASYTGDAQLRFPIELPPGRQGMAPELALTYSSSGGNRWVGLGWDLSVPSITIDTRWGVPRYDVAGETETYLLGGAQLTPVAHRGEPVPRVSPRTFHARVEGSFARIVRYGTDPASYVFEVTDKRGTRFLYGGTPEDGVDPDAVLTTDVGTNEGDIFQWMLRSIVDTNGNSIDFSYRRIVDPGVVGGRDGHDVVLDSIRYTTQSGSGGAYLVQFFLDSDLAFDRRPDVTINARGGFKHVSAERLRRIDVTFNGALMRRYVLDYATGAFHKSLLSSVEQRGVDGALLAGNVHRFDYFDEVGSGDINGFELVDASMQADPLLESAADEPIIPGLDIIPEGGSLNAARTNGISLSMFAGLGLLPASRALSLGVSAGTSGNATTGLLSLMDIDGDGLVDKVFRKADGGTAFRKNMTEPGGDVTFSDDLFDVEFAEGASRSIYSAADGSVSADAKLNLELASFTAGVGYSRNAANTYFTDVNADGIVDLVEDGDVLFGHLTPAGEVSFVPTSEGTFVPLPPSVERHPNAINDCGNELLEVLADATVKFDEGLFPALQLVFDALTEEAGARLGDFLVVGEDEVVVGSDVDTLRRWEAPFDGDITISGAVTIDLPDESRCGSSDGVRVAIQHNDEELWARTLRAEPGFRSRTPTGVSDIAVSKGDRVYFRVGSSEPGCAQVDWPAVVTYAGDEAPDENGRDQREYVATTDFVVTGAREAAVSMPVAGTVRFEGSVTKGITSDAVRVKIIRDDTIALNDDIVVFDSGKIGFSTSETVDLADAAEQIVIPPNLTGGTKLRAHIEVDSNIDLNDLSFHGEVIYTDILGQDAEDEDGNPLLRIPLPFDVDFYPLSNRNSPQPGWVVPRVAPDTKMLVRAEVDAGGDDDVTLTLKRDGRLYSKESFGVHFGSGFVEFKVTPPPEGDVLFFNLSARNPDVFEQLTARRVIVTFQRPDNECGDEPCDPETMGVPASFDGRPPPGFFPMASRGWAVAGYTSTGRESFAIAESDLVVPTSDELFTGRARAFPFTPLAQGMLERWVGPVGTLFVEAGVMSAGGTGGAVAIGAPRGLRPGFAVPRVSETIQIGGDATLFGAVGGSGTWAVSTTCLDYIDINGDRLPDVVGKGSAQLTDPRGRLSDLPIDLLELEPGEVRALRASIADAAGFSLGNASGTRATISANPRSHSDADGQGGALRGGTSGVQDADVTFAISAGVAFNGGRSEGLTDLVDINGDGLLDRVTASVVFDPNAVDLFDLLTVAEALNEAAEEVQLDVQLGVGDHFGDTERWGAARINTGANLRVAGSGGFDSGIGTAALFFSFGGGFSLSMRGSVAPVTLVDINGDGLVDLVAETGDEAGAFEVSFNTGSGFADPVLWSGALIVPPSLVLIDDFLGVSPDTPSARDTNTTKALSSHATASVGGPPFVHFGGDETLSSDTARQETRISDIDGDGFADHLASTQDGELLVARNRTGKTNLLARVERPLGATFDLGYARTGNTVAQPESRFVLSRVTVYDGVAGDSVGPGGVSGTDVQVTALSYEAGHYDRLEREFLGFSRVSETVLDTTSGGGPYRQVVRHYGAAPSDQDSRCDLPAEDNQQRNCGRSYYSKGLVTAERVFDVTVIPTLLASTTYEYFYRDVATGGEADVASVDATIFPELVRVERTRLEAASGAVRTFTRSAYDEVGNEIRFFDAGGSGTADDVTAVVGYTASDPDCAARHIVGLPSTIEVTGGGGELLRKRAATFDCTTGHLTEVRQTADDGTAVTTLGYEDNGNLSFVEGPANLNGERYRLDFKYDDVVETHVTSVTDSFGYVSTASYDLRFGLVTSTTEPNGHGIENSYDDFGRLTRVIGPYEAGEHPYTLDFEYHPDAAVPYARTRHFDHLRDETDDIETMLFIDGLGRVLQTKKDAHVGGADVMVVSGRVVLDHLGRTVAQLFPTTEPKGTANETFNAAFDTEPPTVTDYDVLDRATSITLPDGTSTTLAYAVADDNHGIPRLRTTVTDANGNVKRTYKDARELLTSVREHDGTHAIWTEYQHDGLEQLVRITDDAGNVTRVGYDLLGRRAFVDNPDTGRVDTFYDLAGNLTRKVTPNLRAAGGVAAEGIRYGYRFNRLERISYPEHPENDVSYQYGPPGAPHNQAGRIASITDASGGRKRSYGRLGEVIEEQQTIVHSSGPPASYTTRYLFDTWGRLHRLEYPDGEILQYTYDSGGLVTSAIGEKDGFTYEYVRRVEHDKFGQRALIETGTGIQTTYSYDTKTRRLDTLAAGAFQALSYSYDDVGNITGIHDAARPHTQSFGYDPLYRLTSASGALTERSGQRHAYDLSMGYDAIHNIVDKGQLDRRIASDGSSHPVRGTSYNHAYGYTGPRPHAPTTIGTRTYAYDLNGNLSGFLDSESGDRRVITWDEENRVVAVEDNGRDTSFVYDDAGERKIKKGHSETAYVNQHFTLKSRNVGTKHVWLGTTRMVSKIVPGEGGLGGELDAGGGDEVPGECDPYHTHGNGHAVGHTHGHAYSEFHCHGDPDPSQDDDTGGEGEGEIEAPCALPGEPDEKNFVYYYHPDHLGSTSVVTDCRGEVYRQLAYFPFGEEWVDQASETWRTPYTFTGKELDEETGLYYFGARYYDPRTSVWQSTEPLIEAVPRALVHRPLLLAAYSYSEQRPIVASDPDGNRTTCDSDPATVAQCVSAELEVQAAAGNRMASGAINAIASGRLSPADVARAGWLFGIVVTGTGGLLAVSASGGEADRARYLQMEYRNFKSATGSDVTFEDWKSRVRFLQSDIATSKVRQTQGIAGVRIEAYLGRQIRPGSHIGVDFEYELPSGDAQTISLKGPLPPKGTLGGFISSAAKDLATNTATRQLFVDLTGLDQTAQATVRTAISNAPNPRSKEIIFIGGEL